MSQNRSNAVMATRIEPHDSLDFFPTPPWATRALCEWLIAGAIDLQQLSAWEPACGAGDMARPLSEYFRHVRASDVFDYGFGERLDFLWPDAGAAVDFIITNPPFRLAEQFALTGLERASCGVALLVRTAFLESAARYASLFRETPPSDILQFVERVPMFKGRLDRLGSTATSYCWLIWLRPVEAGATRFHWIPPCRKRLKREGDYPEAPPE
jgi:hypothetical protein